MARLHSLSEDKEIAFLVGVQHRVQDWDVRDSLEELAQLAETAGAEVAEQIVCRLVKPHPATYIGRGKAEEVAAQVRARSISLVVFDDDLTPAQGRNLEQIIGVKVIDRTQMILDIFAQHAHTREGRLQIELAQLQYLLPRLRRMWTHLERQKGGIGLRGPGEKQLELDRRQIQVRISRIRKDLEEVRNRRSEQRRGRRRHGWALLTLVGYTNAGKSTLLNHLTGAKVEADDKLFATLDPTTRQIELPNRQQALVTDTVGFIRKLPHHLVESFKATLEEVIEADLLIHVVDVSHPMVEQQVLAVERVLKELGVETKPMLAALNKIDRPESNAPWQRLAFRFARSVPISALTGQGLDELCHTIADCLKERNTRITVRVPAAEGDLISSIHQGGCVHTQQYEEDMAVIEASVPDYLLGACDRYRVDAGKKEEKGDEDEESQGID